MSSFEFSEHSPPSGVARTPHRALLGKEVDLKLCTRGGYPHNNRGLPNKKLRISIVKNHQKSWICHQNHLMSICALNGLRFVSDTNKGSQFCAPINKIDNSGRFCQTDDFIVPQRWVNFEVSEGSLSDGSWYLTMLLHRV